MTDIDRYDVIEVTEDNASSLGYDADRGLKVQRDGEFIADAAGLGSATLFVSQLVGRPVRLRHDPAGGYGNRWVVEEI